LGPTFFEATLMSQTNLARLPEALRPKPGRLSTTQQRVYEVRSAHVLLLYLPLGSPLRCLLLVS
jgi:hypothetical protein